MARVSAFRVTKPFKASTFAVLAVFAMFGDFAVFAATALFAVLWDFADSALFVNFEDLAFFGLFAPSGAWQQPYFLILLALAAKYSERPRQSGACSVHSLAGRGKVSAS